VTKRKLTKYVIIGLSLLAFVVVLYLVFISYITSNGFRNYQEFCSKYIPAIEEFEENNKKYPSSLAAFKKPEYYPRYDAKKCLYFTNEQGYTIFAPSGLIGHFIYSSETREWHYD